MTRIILSPEEILERYKESEFPGDEASFGPVKSHTQLRPVLQTNHGKNEGNQPAFKPFAAGSKQKIKMPVFDPKRITEKKFVADFSEPARVETFESIVSADPSLHPGANAVPIAADKESEVLTKKGTTKGTTFNKIFEKEMLNRPDQAGHYYDPSKDADFKAEEEKKEEEDNFKVVDSNFAEEEPASVPKFKPLVAKPIPVPTVEDMKKEEKENNKFSPYVAKKEQTFDELVKEEKEDNRFAPYVAKKEPTFDELMKEEKREEKKEEEDNFKVVDSNFAEEEPEFVPRFKPYVAKPVPVPTVEDMKKEQKKNNKFSPYVAKKEQTFNELMKEEKKTAEVVDTYKGPSFDELMKREKESEKKSSKRKATPNFTLKEEPKPELVVEEFQPHTARPMNFAPTLEEAEEARKRAEEEKRKKQQKKGFSLYAEIEKEEEKKKEQQKKEQQQKKKASGFNFESLMNEAENEEKRRQKQKQQSRKTVPQQTISYKVTTPSFAPRQSGRVYSGPSYFVDDEEDEPAFHPKAASEDAFERGGVAVNKKKQEVKKQKSEFELMLEEEQRRADAKKKTAKKSYSIWEETTEDIDVTFHPRQTNNFYEGVDLSALEPKKQTYEEIQEIEKEEAKEKAEEKAKAAAEKKKQNKERKKQKSEFELMLEEEQKRNQKKQKPATRNYDIEPEEKEDITPSFNPKQTNKVYDGLAVSALNKPTKAAHAQEPKEVPAVVEHKEEPKVEEQPKVQEQPKRKGKKRKFVSYLSPDAPEVVSHPTAAKASTGPSFNDLLEQEERSKPKQKTQSRTSRYFVNDDEDGEDFPSLSFNPQSRQQKYGGGRTAAKSNGFDFNALLESEEKQEKKRKPAQVPTYKAATMSYGAPSFDELMREEKEKETLYEEAAMDIFNQEQQAAPVFEEDNRRSNRSRKGRGRGRDNAPAVDEDLFWGYVDPNAAAEPDVKKDEYPSLASMAPGQKRKSIKKYNDANKAMHEIASKRPAEYLARQIEKSGIDQEEANELAESIVNYGKFEMITALQSVLPNPRKASAIVSGFFRAFPNGK